MACVLVVDNTATVRQFIEFAKEVRTREGADSELRAHRQKGSSALVLYVHHKNRGLGWGELLARLNLGPVHASRKLAGEALARVVAQAGSREESALNAWASPVSALSLAQAHLNESIARSLQQRMARGEPIRLRDLGVLALTEVASASEGRRNGA